MITERGKRILDWLTWGRLTHFVVVFLTAKLLVNAIKHDHPILIDFISIFFYAFGLLCGIALTLSVDRRLDYILPPDSPRNTRKK